MMETLSIWDAPLAKEDLLNQAVKRAFESVLKAGYKVTSFNVKEIDLSEALKWSEGVGKAVKWYRLEEKGLVARMEDSGGGWIEIYVFNVKEK